MTAEIDDVRRRSFDRNAALYDAARPSYPDALVDAIFARTRARRIVEIGAGTGKATVPFARRGVAHGVAIDALEPGPSMAAILRERVAPYPSVRVVETTFEDWDGDAGAYDLVLAAQSIHWIDPAVRYAKIARALAAGGWACIVRNEKAGWDPELRAELDAAYARWPPPRDNQPGDSAADARREYAAQLAASNLFGPVVVEEVAWHQRYTTREYLDLLATYSDHALLAADARASLFAAIAAAIDRRGGAFVVPYVSLAFLAQRGV
ncbi:MAG TPA: class I SAM-dependent methyltransferase [Kofleriaceae bacterium]|nr:class I SAM-dependent methyltransferase [Kofleriaceae bacterium]